MDPVLVRAIQQVDIELREMRPYIPRQAVTITLLHDSHAIQRAFLRRLTEQNDAYDREQQRLKLEMAQTLASLEASSPTPEYARA